jgi:hypothetical protein
VIAKTAQKLQAVKLRRQGLSYSEILRHIHVSQSSLTLWLHGIELSESQKSRLISKGNEARKLGSATLRENRIFKTNEIIKKAASEISKIDKDDLMLVGTTLYWAEGSKQKEHDPSKEVIFSNSDPRMIKIYLQWLKMCLEIPSEQIVFEIYIHESHKKSIPELSSYWSKVTNFPASKFNRVYYKKNKIHSLRKNRGADYSGVLRVSVKRSTDLNRKIQGWIQGIYFQSGVASSNEL